MHLSARLQPCGPVVDKKAACCVTQSTFNAK